MATTDFEAWLDEADPDGHEEVNALYYAVFNVEDGVPYSCTTNNGQWFVTTNYTDSTLRLASEEARQAFLKTLERKYCGDMDIDSWYGFKSALENDKS